MVGGKRKCVFGCKTDGIYTHRFPHPEKKPELFKSWLSVVGNHLKESDPMKIYNNKRVCNYHFKLADKTSGHRLVVSACPTINLGEVQQSINTIVDEEHNYSFARQASSVPFILGENKLTAEPEDIPTFPTNIEVEEPFDNEEVLSNGLRSTDLDTNATNEGATIIYEEGSDWYEIITECDNGIDEFIAMPSRTEVSPAGTKQRRDSVSSNFTGDILVETDNLYEVHDEYLMIPPRCDDFLPTTEQQGDSESNDDVGPFTEPGKSYDGVKEFSLLSPPSKAHLPTAKRRRIGEENKTIWDVLNNKVCDNCRIKISGLHYKCLHCDDYNHCHKCELQEAHPNHYMIRMPKSLEFEVPDEVMHKMYDEFRPVINLIEESQTQESILSDDNSKAYDSEVDFSEDLKSVIGNEATRVVKNEFVGGMKRKKIITDNTSKKGKMAVPTATINEEIPGMGQNGNAPTLESENNVADVEKNNNAMSTIATVITVDTCQGAVQMELRSDVTQLILEMVKNGEKIVYKYS